MKYTFTNVYKTSISVFYGIISLCVLLGTLGFFVFREYVVGIDPYTDSVVVLKTVVVLFTLFSIPVTLKLSKVKINKIQHEKDEIKFPAYLNIAIVRLLVIGLGLILNVFLYTIFRDNYYLFCACISGFTILFCIPGKQKIKEELELDGSIQTLIKE